MYNNIHTMDLARFEHLIDYANLSPNAPETPG